MVEFDSAESKSEHERILGEYLLEKDPTFGAILAPLLNFDALEQMSENERRTIRSQVATEVRKALDDGLTP